MVEIGTMKMQEFGEIKKHLDRVTHELIRIKKLIIGLEVKDKRKTERAWDDLMSVSKEISLTWKGETAVEEIRDQREKRW
jgi:hypothetical protein